MTGRLDLGMLVAEVATRLRAGASAESAWRQTLVRAGLRTDIGPDGVPLALREMWHEPRWRTGLGAAIGTRQGSTDVGTRPGSPGVTGPGAPGSSGPGPVGSLGRGAANEAHGGTPSSSDSWRPARAGYRTRGRGRPGSRHRSGIQAWPALRMGDEARLGIPPAIAVCKMSGRTGAPMADVLESCAEGITEAGEAAAARRVALAGPRASARVLAWLPMLGLAFGTLLGVAPLEFLLSHPAGRVCLALGIAFETAGLAWVRRLVRRAERQV